MKLEITECLREEWLHYGTTCTVNHYAAIVRTTRPRYVLIGEDLEPMLPKLP